MKICKSFILPFITPILVCLIVYSIQYLLIKLIYLIQYLLNKRFNFSGKINVILIQYVLCAILLFINSLYFFHQNIDLTQYLKDVNEDIPIQGWFIDYFYLRILCLILYVRILYLRNTNKSDKSLLSGSANENPTNKNQYSQNFSILYYIFPPIILYISPGSFILNVMFNLYKINKYKYLYSTNFQRYTSLVFYSAILFAQSYGWIDLVVKWDNLAGCFLDGFVNISTYSSLYITALMIIVYLFQVILFIEINDISNIFFTSIIIVVAFCNGTIGSCLYMIYFELYKTKLIINK
jgi:hypothetical protein